MDLNYYFEPVSLERPAGSVAPDELTLGRSIRINTASHPIDEISNYQLAIFGVPEDRNSTNSGASAAPNHIRQKLYELYRVNDKLRIIDLGNLKQAARPEDTYFGVRDVIAELLNNQVIAIVLGGSQDVGYGIYMAYEQRATKINVVTVDSRIDLHEGYMGSHSWNIPLLKSPGLFRYTHIGHQQYLVNSNFADTLENKGFDVLRLGAVRANLLLTEPFLRDAHMVSFDISSVKQSEAPGTIYASPNGLLAEEACQISRYAGLSDLVSCFGIFEVNGILDSNHQTAHLAAQAIWYFMEGYIQRKKEKPVQNNTDFKVFMVNHSDMEHTLVFYKSLITGRWWMEVPDMKSEASTLVACSQEEYQQACNHEIPEMWWKAFRRIN
jgi:formiminoglutamase